MRVKVTLLDESPHGKQEDYGIMTNMQLHVSAPIYRIGKDCSVFRIAARLACLFVLSLLLALSGCKSVPVQDTSDDAEFSSISDTTARRLLRGGQIEAASDRYVKLAEQASNPTERDENLLVAAEILYDRGIQDLGRKRLQSLNPPLTTPALQQRYQILEAKDALFNNDPEAALAALPEADTVQAPIHRARLHEVQAQAWSQLNQPGLELSARIALEEQLTNANIIDQNHNQIWRLLSAQPQSLLRELTTEVQNNTYQGWLELALIKATLPNNDPGYAEAINRWQQQYPEHPANARFLATLSDDRAVEPLQLNTGPINQIGVLLPFSAPGIASAAAAIRDGMVIAYQYDLDRANPPTLKFYDSGANPLLARTAYQEALTDGADAIIGPLLKDSVTAIATMRQIPVPTVTLNTVDSNLGNLPPNLVQFGLSPEDEARAAARRMLSQGLRHAVVLQSDDSRGDRESRAFHEEMLQYGADVVFSAILPAEDYDFSKQIRDALLISQSDARFHRLGQVVPGRIHFEPAIRDDLDAIFLAMGSEQAQSVRPQLAFYRASQVPMLGTSRIMTSIDDKRATKDLNGIQFPDTPWTLDPTLQSNPVYQTIVRNYPEATGVFARLYALGVDAYRVTSNLQALLQRAQQPPTFDDTSNGNFSLASAERQLLPGFTGDLWLDDQHRIRRELRWGQYHLGAIEPINATDPLVKSTDN